MQCKRCKSHAINPQCHGRDDTDIDLCDVCYWRKRAEISRWKSMETAPKDRDILLKVLKKSIDHAAHQMNGCGGNETIVLQGYFDGDDGWQCDAFFQVDGVKPIGWMELIYGWS